MSDPMLPAARTMARGIVPAFWGARGNRHWALGATGGGVRAHHRGLLGTEQIEWFRVAVINAAGAATNTKGRTPSRPQLGRDPR